MNDSMLKTVQQNFLKELTDANMGKKTSLPFIANPLPSRPLIKNGDVFQAIVIGGTICVSALTKLDEKNNIEIVDKKILNIKSLKTKNDLLTLIENLCDSQTKTIGISFAFPLTPVFENNKLDGILIAGAKEHSLLGLIGKKVGKEIETYIFEKKKQALSVSVANDTVCLLLSGLTKYKPDNLACGIVGTGLNFAFFLNQKTVVNLESASFDKFPKSKEVENIDKNSNNPGSALFEKETAGAYLYKHFNLILNEKNIPLSPINSTEELNNISLKNIPTVSEIAKNLITKSAQLIACQVAGITEFKKQDITFVMQGSFFWKGNGYKETVESEVKKLVSDYKINFIEIEESAILGAAKLIA